MTDTTAVEAGATPAPGATPGTVQDTDADASATQAAAGDDLGDAGKRALAEVRRQLRAKDAQLAEKDNRIVELEDAGRSELERAQAEATRLTETLRERDAAIAERDARIAELESNDMRRDIAKRAGIPDLWQRLHGSNEAELVADAKELAGRVNPAAGAPDLGAGARPGGPATGEPGMSQLIRRKAGR